MVDPDEEVPPPLPLLEVRPDPAARRIDQLQMGSPTTPSSLVIKTLAFFPSRFLPPQPPFLSNGNGTVAKAPAGTVFFP